MRWFQEVQGPGVLCGWSGRVLGWAQVGGRFVSAGGLGDSGDGRSEGESDRCAVCQGRAVAHGRLAVGRFVDPTALALLRDGERPRVEHARAEVLAKAWSQRMDAGLIRLQAESMTARIVAIDDAVRAAGHQQLGSSALVSTAGRGGCPTWPTSRCSRSTTPPLRRTRQTEPPAYRPPPDRWSSWPSISSRLYSARRWLRQAPTRRCRRPGPRGGGPVPRPPASSSHRGGHRRPVGTGQPAGGHYQVRSVRAAFGRLLARTFLRLRHRQDPVANEPRRSSWTQASVRVAAHRRRTGRHR